MVLDKFRNELEAGLWVIDEPESDDVNAPVWHTKVQLTGENRIALDMIYSAAGNKDMARRFNADTTPLSVSVFCTDREWEEVLRLSKLYHLRYRLNDLESHNESHNRYMTNFIADMSMVVEKEINGK